MKKVLIVTALALLSLVAGCGAEPPAAQEIGGTITAYPEALNLDPGAQETLQVRLDPAQLEEQGAAFTSSDPDVATVAEDGTVTALASGMCTVTVAARADSTIRCRVEVTVGDGRDAAICLPGDVVYGCSGGVLFIPPQLVVDVVDDGAKTQVKDLFGFEMISQNKFTTAQIDKKTWSEEMLDLLMEFIRTDERAAAYRDIDWSKEYDLARNGDPTDTQSAL